MLSTAIGILDATKDSMFDEDIMGLAGELHERRNELPDEIFAKYLFIRNSKLYISNTSVCLLSFYLMVLWPITTNGNLFGNWLSVMYFLPAGFYLFYKKSDRI